MQDKITIVAEMSSNHNGDMGRMLRMIDEAKKCGADMVKFQLYDTDKLKREPQYYPTLRRGQLSHIAWKCIVAHCNRVGVEFFASVFDTERVKWCEEVGIKRYKISSFDIYNKPLIEAIVATGKPIIMSLGLMDARGKPIIRNRQVDYLYCVSKYPAELSDIDFSGIDFREYSGFSDHTIGIAAVLMAMARGARIIEKHFTLDKSLDGCDHRLSMNPSDLEDIVYYARQFEKIGRGSGVQSLFIVEDVEAGQRFTAHNVQSLSSSGGLSPELIGWVLRSSSAYSVKAGTPLSLGMIDPVCC